MVGCGKVWDFGGKWEEKGKKEGMAGKSRGRAIESQKCAFLLREKMPKMEGFWLKKRGFGKERNLG